MVIHEPEIHEEAASDMLEPWRALADQRPSARLPNGAAAAAVLAAGAGSALYGLLVMLTESIAVIHDAMNLNKDVGPLSGKTTFGVLAWLVVWGVLHALWRNRDINFSRAFTIALTLVGVALLLTFPPVFLLFALD
jgi:hypothetical protein